MTGGTTNPCGSCRAGFPNECEYAWDDENWISCGEIQFTMTGEVKSREGSSDLDAPDTGYISDGYESAKSIDQYKDPVSTGRKRAAQMYPIEVGMVCEWAGLKRAGGGVFPIVGCIGRAASDRHHGPDKNTMNNGEGNVHRICDHCHNTWHAANDPSYGPRPEHTQPFIPKGKLDVDWFAHDAKTRASVQEVLDAETQRLAESS